MTMDLSHGSFFESYIRALNNRRLAALDEWQGERLCDSPSKETVLDATSKKRTIYLEQKRRESI